MTTPGKQIDVSSKDGRFSADVSVNRQWEESVVLDIFLGYIREGWALEEMASILGGKVLVGVLMDTVRLSDLRPWVTYQKRDDFHGYVWKRADFWSDWGGQGFKLPAGAPSKCPTDAEWKRLEWSCLEDEIEDTLGDPKKIKAFLGEKFDEDESMIRLLVGQCYFDERCLARKCLEAAGGLEKYWDVRELPEGFILYVNREPSTGEPIGRPGSSDLLPGQPITLRTELSGGQSAVVEEEVSPGEDKKHA